MDSKQSPYIPAEGKKPRPRDLLWLLAYGLRALYELVKARIAFIRFEAKEIPCRNKWSKMNASTSKVGKAHLDRMTYIIPRLSNRLPWRSDCLIQSIAAQNWLSAYGVASEIRIGVENPDDGIFGAHAWLVHNEIVVTGGEVERYQMILSDSEEKAENGPPEHVNSGKKTH